MHGNFEFVSFCHVFLKIRKIEICDISLYAAIIFLMITILVFCNNFCILTMGILIFNSRKTIMSPYLIYGTYDDSVIQALSANDDRSFESRTS